MALKSHTFDPVTLGIEEKKIQKYKADARASAGKTAPIAGLPQDRMGC